MQLGKQRMLNLNIDLNLYILWDLGILENTEFGKML